MTTHSVDRIVRERRERLEQALAEDRTRAGGRSRGLEDRHLEIRPSATFLRPDESRLAPPLFAPGSGMIGELNREAPRASPPTVAPTLCRRGHGAGLGGRFRPLRAASSPRPLPGDPEAERPNLNLSGAVPPVSQVLNMPRDSAPIAFTVPFTSVDGGRTFGGSSGPIGGAGGESSTKITDGSPVRLISTRMGGAPATERSVLFVWAPSGTVPSGCNQLTLFVAHDGNVNFEDLRPIDFSQAAMATFWVNVGAPLGQGQTLVDCPLPAVSP